MIKVNDALVNELASDFAKTGNQVAFNDMFVEVFAFLQYMAGRASSRALNRGVRIPAEDFESYFAQALYIAAKGFDPTLGDFMPRFQRFMKRQEPNVWRKYETKGGENDRNGKRYDKAQLDSLDRDISDDGEGFTLGEAVLEPVVSAEKEYFEKEEIRKMLADFWEVNERYAKVVILLDRGLTNDELAFTFGEREYNAKIRQLVHRAKESFRKFLSDRQSV